MILRYDFGTPIPTGAVVQALPVQEGPVPHFDVTRGEDGSVTFAVRLGPEDVIYGLGEAVRGINKRGHLYRAWNSDDFSHTENKASLYASHNLLLFSGDCGLFGAYFDDPGEVVFDLAFTDLNAASITSLNGNFSLYILEEESLIALCRAFRGLTGPSYVPPRWALGFLQSRWGYASEAEVRAVADGYRSRHIPLDGICLDIDYMQDFRDFTWNHEAFPDMAGFAAEMKKDHIRLVPIIDAGIKKMDGDPIYDEGREKGYFCKKADGSDFVGAVWPGRSVFPDFLRPEVRRWFGDKYRVLLEAGIEGFWNDMNEPALFYSEEGLAEAYEKAEELRGENLDIDTTFQLQGAFAGLNNNRKDYQRFYHQVEGKSIRHDKVHNLYGMSMTRAAAEGMAAYNPDKRHLLFARSSFVGAHRYGGVWQGDNTSWWSHILLNLRMLPSLSMCGFLYTGADLGGFSCDTTADLLLRWLQLGVFTPLMRDHSAHHTRMQEIYRFDNWADMRSVLTVRYALLPFLYSELMKAALSDGMLFRPLGFDYPDDPMAIRTEDQVMLGSAAMIAPVYEQNARGRHVYLPEDMLMIRFRSAEDYDLAPMTAGHHWIDLRLNEFPLFLRRGAVLPLARAAECSELVDDTAFTLLGWVDDTAEYLLYRDDGFTTYPALPGHLTALRVLREGGEVKAEGEDVKLEVGGVVGE